MGASNLRQSADASGKDRKAFVGITPFEIKMSLMRGSGNILGKVGNAGMVQSSYQFNFKGSSLQFPNPPIKLDTTTSCSTGVCVPDPMLQTKRHKAELEF